MNISQEGIALIKRFEGCELEAYLDSVGIPTIAYGRIKNVRMGDTCTQEQAESWLEEELPEYEGYINDLVKVDLTQCQFDALCSWVYNLGPNNLKESTLLRVLNEGDYSSVPAEIKRWNKAGGKVLEGLMRRREAEALLFEDKEWLDV
jgi:lysozyme